MGPAPNIEVVVDWDGQHASLIAEYETPEIAIETNTLKIVRLDPEVPYVRYTLRTNPQRTGAYRLDAVGFWPADIPLHSQTGPCGAGFDIEELAGGSLKILDPSPRNQQSYAFSLQVASSAGERHRLDPRVYNQGAAGPPFGGSKRALLPIALHYDPKAGFSWPDPGTKTHQGVKYQVRENGDIVVKSLDETVKELLWHLELTGSAGWHFSGAGFELATLHSEVGACGAVFEIGKKGAGGIEIANLEPADGVRYVMGIQLLGESGKPLTVAYFPAWNYGISRATTTAAHLQEKPR